jgi:acetyl esterase/lipase/lysophospholipase L1-like esterase
VFALNRRGRHFSLLRISLTFKTNLPIMNRIVISVFLLLFTLVGNAQQKVVPLYGGASPGTESWTYSEKEMGEPNPLVYNVSHPTLTVYLPDPAIATGTAVVLCPGGGFYILAIKNEGTDVVKWLNQKGVAVFLLKYRLGQSLTENPGQELGDNMKKPDFESKVAPLVPFAIADGKAAIAYVRAHAAEYNVSASRIGIMGFSAGGTVAASAAFNYTPDNRPDFVAPIYPYIPAKLQGPVAADAPPLFLTTATDDGLNLAPHSVDLYSKWLAAKHPAELHMYQKGGHGFGMRKQSIPTDNWIDRFGEWLGLNCFLTPTDPKVAAHVAQMDRLSKTPDWPNIRRYAAADSAVQAPAAGENRVVFLGNSITDSWIYADPTFFSSHLYLDRGISGQTTGQMLVRFREDVINLKPAAVVILAGINDIAQNNGPSRIEDVFGNIVSMAELAKANNIKVVLSSVMPAYSFPWRQAIDPKPGVAALNTLLKTYCEKNNIVYLDYFTAMADERRGLPANLSRDGVHPNLDGYKIMEPLAEKAIANALKK